MLVYLAAMDATLSPPMPPRSGPIRACIVEDDFSVRESLVYLLSRRGFDIAGHYATAEALLEAVGTFSPPCDIVLLDLDLPGMHGTDAIRRLRRLDNAPEVLVLTVFDDRETLLAALKAGASGYILKDAPFEDIVRWMNEVLDGGAPMSPAVARRVLREFQPEDSLGPDKERDPEVELSRRERDVLDLLIGGYTYDEIAGHLQISAGTVQVHIKHIYKKLGVHSRTEAVTKAIKAGMLD